MRLAVIVPSLGRPQIVGQLMADLARQTRRPDLVLVPVVSREDGPARTPEELAIEVILSPKGACAQRNRGLDRGLADIDVVTFFDDDFVPAPDYLENLVALFAANPSLAGATGVVLADGATSAGVEHREAQRIIASHARGAPTTKPVHCLYGCNMSYRARFIRDMRFDERLPLYGWLEDVDFSTRAGRKGDLVWSDRLVGVHLGVKAGKTSGVRFGYSQIVNPIYLFQKGTIPFGQTAANIMRNFAANHARALAPEPYVDRRGRVKGNWLAIGDLMRGRAAPERILDF
ncbi:MAG: glycosyltransferase family 2 protein [Amphiplicatus sp.]